MIRKTIGECFCYIQNGANIKQGVVDGGYPITRIETISNNQFNRDRMGYAGITELGKYEANVLEDGDLLMSHINSVQYLGRTVLYKKIEDEVIIHGMNLLRLKANRNIIDPAYARYYFSSIDFKRQMENITKKSVNQASFAVADLKKLGIILPDLSKQQAIVDELDRIQNLIQLRMIQLDLFDELIKSRFVELFGDSVVNPKSWETAPLSALIINANNGMARRGKDADGSIVLRLVELQNGFIDYSAPNRICLNETEKKRYELIDNDFLFARVNGNPDYVGRCAVFKSIDEPVFHNDHIIRVHFDEAKINGCFMSVLLNSDYGKRQMRKQIKTSAGQYTISQDGIGAIMAILPPMELQNQFAAFVEQTDKSKVVIQESLRIAEYLFDSLMQKYFGE